MPGELTSIPYDLADHLTVALAPSGVKVSPWPPDGVGEPAVWVEVANGAAVSARRTVNVEVVAVTPAGQRAQLAGLTDAVWDALDSWRPVTPGVAVDRNALDWTAGTELVAADSLPGVRFTLPATYRPC